jgi:hypothetical protein
MGNEGPAADIAARIAEAASLIRGARYLTAFTGAGISVGSGIPPFRGEGGLWSKYDPRMLELGYFLAHPEKSWPILREIFYEHFGTAKPNRAHEVLAAWEARGLLKVLITQNIDNLHSVAGIPTSPVVSESRRRHPPSPARSVPFPRGLSSWYSLVALSWQQEIDCPWLYKSPPPPV